MNAWRMTGMQARLVLPSVVALTGTLRQPKNRCPCSRTMASKAASAAVRRLSSRTKQHAHAIAPGAGSVPHQMAFSFQKSVRQLGQDACAITRVRFGTCSAPVFQIA